MARAADGRPHTEQNPPRLRSGCGPAAVFAQPSQDRHSYRQEENRITLG
jgi:hypothetical protein